MKKFVSFLLVLTIVCAMGSISFTSFAKVDNTIYSTGDEGETATVDTSNQSETATESSTAEDVSEPLETTEATEPTDSTVATTESTEPTKETEATKPTAIIAVPLLLEALHKKINQTIDKSGKTSMVNTMIRLTNGLRNVGIDVKRKVFKDIYASLGGRMRILVSAAAPIDMKVGKWFEDIGLLFLQGYGLTETAPIAALTPDFDTRVGSAGKAVHGDEIMIKNPNERGEGEILIKGKTVMLGYYENPEATAEVMEDGWFNSGDIGYLDEDGFLYITGRSKNVIVTQNGKNIYPEEIEGLLGKVPEIAECMVYGKEVSGEKELIITAKVIPDYDAINELHGKEKKDPESPFTEDEIYKIIWNQIKQVNRKLTNYKCVKKLEIKTDQFEKTSTMKIKRFAELQKDKDKAAETAEKTE